MRKAKIVRKTKETEVAADINLDGTGQYSISTGVGFLNHMIEQLAHHSLFDISIQTIGDLDVDDHHTTEDTAIAIGQGISSALGNREGIGRYAATYIAMDESLTRVAIDISGRPHLVWNVKFSSSKIGTFDVELVREFFQALAQHAGITINVNNIDGINNHHIAESCFKALARSLRDAVKIDEKQIGRVPSTKGSLQG